MLVSDQGSLHPPGRTVINPDKSGVSKIIMERRKPWQRITPFYKKNCEI